MVKNFAFPLKLLKVKNLIKLEYQRELLWLDVLIVDLMLFGVKNILIKNMCQFFVCQYLHYPAIL